MALRALYDVAAPAKLNLFLHVVGRRADGYHLLQSAFVLLDWHDRLHFERRGDGRLARHDHGADLPADDLCLRAARLLQSESGTASGVDITLEKRLPWGAGLGGGSSDAASTLLALNRLWRLDWSRARLATLGERLGADVPFFVHGRNAFVEGIGERVTPVELPAQRYAVVKPPEHIGTAAIFASPLLARDSAPVIVEGLTHRACGQVVFGDALIQGRFGRNDLQAAAEANCSAVRQAAHWLDGHFGVPAGPTSRMTGSGSAVFLHLGPAEETEIVDTARLDDLPAGWNGRICRSLASHPLADWARDGGHEAPA